MTTPTTPQQEREGCGHERSARTGFARLTMPIQHQRECPDCGALFWAIPANFGASFTAIERGVHLPSGKE